MYIRSRGEVNLVSPRGFQKVNQLIICALAKINSRGEFHEAIPKADLSDARWISRGRRVNKYVIAETVTVNGLGEMSRRAGQAVKAPRKQQYARSERD